MTRPDNITIIAALQSVGGLVAPAANRLHVSRKTLFKWVAEDEELKLALDEIRQETLDLAEGVLLSLIRDKDREAVKFYLRTIGRDRGYGDRVQVSGPNGGPIAVAPADPLAGLDLDKLSLEELEQLRATMAKATITDAPSALPKPTEG